MDPLYFMRDQSLTLNADLDFRCKINPCNIEFIENMAIAYLPPFDSSLLINISLYYNNILICYDNTPNLFNILKNMLKNSNIWHNLYFKHEIMDANKDSNISFIIKLTDDLFDISLFNDLILSPSEQIKLNKIHLITINSINITICINNLTDFKKYWISGFFIKDLNFILFNSFLKFEEKMPLIFNFISRSTYLSTKDVLNSIISTCVKSNVTYVIEQRSILSGLIKSLLNCKSWIESVNEMSYTKLNKELENDDGFTITWFNPL